MKRGDEIKIREPVRTLPPQPLPQPDPHKLERILGAVMRVRILGRLHSVKEARSPMELSKELRRPVSNVSYHCRILKEEDVIVLTDTRQLRGATESFYASAIIENPAAMRLLARRSADEEDSGSSYVSPD